MSHPKTSDSIRTMFLVAACCLLLPLVNIDAAAAGDVRDIGSRRELFVDHFLIGKLDGLRLKLHEPAPTPLVPGTPSGHYATVIKDGSVFRRFDRGGSAKFDGDSLETTHYWESRDGVHWSGPDLGLFAVDGSRKNNVIVANTKWIAHNFSPFLDRRPGVPKQARFKALAGVHKGGGLFGFSSGDGIHWQKLKETPIITSRAFAFDSQNVSFWSESEQCYVCYFRTWKTPHGSLRTISRCVSEDFIRWSVPVAMNPNRPGEHLYTSGTHPYFRAPHIYVALPTRFMPDRGASTDIMFMTSRGTNHYDRTFGQAFIRPGLDPSKWGNRSNYAALNVVPTGPAEMSIYVRERRYTIRTDGFASVHATDRRGELLTRPIRFKGQQLEINYSTSAAGDIRVEIQDSAGKPIRGFSLMECPPLVGDHVKRVVKWARGHDLSSLAGKPVRLRFVMIDSDLFSLRFRDSKTP
ncbi:MAG: hypothetical protein QF363_14735 [Planctomycetaceae bacterium]|jgi:hypothetical protein|nr:hypothetical protein [Planctomycetaceae bacterium]